MNPVIRTRCPSGWPASLKGDGIHICLTAVLQHFTPRDEQEWRPLHADNCAIGLGAFTKEGHRWTRRVRTLRCQKPEGFAH